VNGGTDLALMDLALPLAVACRGRGGTCALVAFVPFDALHGADALRGALTPLRWALVRARHGEGKHAVDALEPRCPACLLSESGQSLE
jgi:hypothetical protein